MVCAVHGKNDSAPFAKTFVIHIAELKQPSVSFGSQSAPPPDEKLGTDLMYYTYTTRPCHVSHGTAQKICGDNL